MFEDKKKRKTFYFFFTINYFKNILKNLEELVTNICLCLESF